ncbi:MAG: S8 family peptidase [Ardenticatenales bacterium]|nr:S8 family peptidase [Ardenticatenales bacterium]
MNPTKLHKSLSVTMSGDVRPDEQLAVILKYKPSFVARGEVGALSDIAPSQSFHLVSAQATDATPSMIAALTDDPAVEMIWPDLPVHTWADTRVPLIGVPRVVDAGFGGQGVRIGIVDTGIDRDHPDFEGRIAAWRDLIDENADAAHDPNGHGTHVAGIAAGSGAAGGGRYKGVAPQAMLVIARALDAEGGGRTSTVMAGIEWAIDNGAQVVNISLGGPPYPADGTDALSVLCNAAVEAGIVVCVAAGNMGPAGHTIGAPSAARRVITVGASEATAGDPTDRVAGFSSRGPTGDGSAKPELIFPGVGIVSARAAGTGLGRPVDAHYTALRGTSQATPFATGAVALLLSANPRLKPDEVRERLVRGAERLPGVDVLAQGAGRGNAYNAFVNAQGRQLGAGAGAGTGAGAGAGSGAGSGGEGGGPAVPTPPSSPADSTARSGCLPASLGAFKGR